LIRPCYSALHIIQQVGKAADSFFQRTGIDCTAAQSEVADNMYQRSELDDLIYNDPAAYLKTVTEYKPLD
jgi:hypothetical protein